MMEDDADFGSSEESENEVLDAPPYNSFPAQLNSESDSDSDEEEEDAPPYVPSKPPAIPQNYDSMEEGEDEDGPPPPLLSADDDSMESFYEEQKRREQQQQQQKKGGEENSKDIGRNEAYLSDFNWATFRTKYSTIQDLDPEIKKYWAEKKNGLLLELFVVFLLNKIVPIKAGPFVANESQKNNKVHFIGHYFIDARRNYERGFIRNKNVTCSNNAAQKKQSSGGGKNSNSSNNKNIYLYLVTMTDERGADSTTALTFEQNRAIIMTPYPLTPKYQQQYDVLAEEILSREHCIANLETGTMAVVLQPKPVSDFATNLWVLWYVLIRAYGVRDINQLQALFDSRPESQIVNSLLVTFQAVGTLIVKTMEDHMRPDEWDEAVRTFMSSDVERDELFATRTTKSLLKLLFGVGTTENSKTFQNYEQTVGVRTVRPWTMTEETKEFMLTVLNRAHLVVIDVPFLEYVLPSILNGSGSSLRADGKTERLSNGDLNLGYVGVWKTPLPKTLKNFKPVVPNPKPPLFVF